MARLPVEPLREWIEGRLVSTTTGDLARELGVDERRLFAWREENDFADRDVLEDALNRAGVYLWEVYDSESRALADGVVPERFWRFVPYRPEDPDECWLWWGAMSGRRGTNPTFSASRGHNVPAARFVYAAVYGDPGERYVWRKCDDRRCVRPEHLCVRPPRVHLPRGQWGEKNPNSKLSDAEVRNLRVLYSRGATQKQLADHYGLTNQAVGYIIRGAFRRAAGGPISESRGRELVAA